MSFFKKSKIWLGQSRSKWPTKWPEMKKNLNTKIVQLLRIYILYIGQFCIWPSFSRHYSQKLESPIDFMKLRVRLVDFELWFAKTFSNAKIVYIWNVDLDKRNISCLRTKVKFCIDFENELKPSFRSGFWVIFKHFHEMVLKQNLFLR